MMLELKFKLARPGFGLDVDLSLDAHGVVGVMGASGVGKTTLLRVISGLERVPDGFFRLGNQIWQDSDVFVPAHQRAVGYVFQEASLFPHLNVRQNIEYGAKRRRRTRGDVDVSGLVELLGIDALLARKPNRLSGGERRRVAIARAMASQPKLLLLDEPMSGLDEARRAEVLPFLRRLCDRMEIPAIYVSHSRAELAQLADHLVLLDQGSVRAEGAMDALATDLSHPLALQADAQFVILATAQSQADEFGLTQFAFDGGEIIAASDHAIEGKPVRLRVRARDISLCRVEPIQTSILNIVGVTIEAMQDIGPAGVAVRIKTGNTSMLSHITRRSAQQLELKPGDHVFAQIKSVAVLD